MFKVTHLFSNPTWLVIFFKRGEGEEVQHVRYAPIKSQVCSLAELSLLMMVAGPGGTPLGAAADWMAGEMAGPFEEEGPG